MVLMIKPSLTWERESGAADVKQGIADTTFSLQENATHIKRF